MSKPASHRPRNRLWKVARHGITLAAQDLGRGAWKGPTFHNYVKKLESECLIYSPCFTHEKTEAQRGQDYSASQGRSQSSHPGLRAPSAMCSFHNTQYEPVSQQVDV